MAQNTTKELYPQTRESITMPSNAENNVIDQRPARAHMAPNTAVNSPAPPRQARIHSPIANRSNSQASALPAVSNSLSSSTCDSLDSLLSTSFGSTPSLALSFDSVNTADTLNYDGSRKMATPVIPVCEAGLEKRDVHIATREQLEGLIAAHPLPELAPGKWAARWRRFRHGTMSAYMRLWLLALLVNFALVIAMVCQVIIHPGSFTYRAAATATGANLLVAALNRHEHFINLIFRLATALPYRTPLAIRRHAAKIYSHGGVHSGCGLSAVLWYTFYTGLAIAQFEGTQAESIALVVTTAATLICLIVIISMAHPAIRARWHDQWEISHRFSGWLAIALVWSQTLVIAFSAANHADSSLGLVLVKTPTFWFLIIITVCLIYPWLHLRKRPVKAEVLSSHAVRLWFDDKTMPSCVGARLSFKPLLENHGFATIPNSTDLETGLATKAEASDSSSSTTSSSAARGKGFSVLVSRAGDFTSSLIDNPPTAIYTRGYPTRGVLHIAHLFKPIVLIATGSGIGPCLSFLQVYPSYPIRIIWSARSPLATYGQEVMDSVLRADEKAVVIDTKVTKKPDLSAISYALAKQTGSEAVVIISNPKGTREVVFALECRGMPAFGAIFDS